MRQVGVIASRELAQRFGDYLLSVGIGSQVREQRDGFGVWVYDEDAVAHAEGEFSSYLAHPEDARFSVAVKAAPVKAATDEASREVPMPRTWARAPSLLDVPVTLSLLILSVGVTLLTQFGESESAMRQVVMTPATFHGEPWRAVLPIFLHFGFLHLLFNVLWLRDLGGLIEYLKGRTSFAAIVLALALVSNTAQYLASGPGFGGMSGVVYGLFGYVWVKSKREPWSGFVIDPQTVWLMMAWFALCFTGWFGPIANYAHGGGLVTGVLLGLIPGRSRRG